MTSSIQTGAKIGLFAQELDLKSGLQSLDYSILQQCMHCGLCLPSCPTYVESKRERSSPRGRIALMRAVAGGELGVTDTFAYEMSYCVGCLACTTACPAGVNYVELLETARADAESSPASQSTRRRTFRALLLRGLFLRPWAFRAAGTVLRFYQNSGLQPLVRVLLPRRWRDLESQAPRIRRQFSDTLIEEIESPPGPRRHRALLLTGCVQDLAYSDVNRATADVLLANGCEVVTPRGQSCCGSLHAHNGDLETARELARRQLDAVDLAEIDAVISNAAGCGSHLKRYGHLLADDPRHAARAAEWTAKLRDISEWLVEIGFRPPKSPAAGATPTRLTYHDACHLCHAQKITTQPRALLAAIPGVTVVECAESTWCCGSAGIYSLTHPDTARWLRVRKLAHLQATGAATVATANPGCQLHLENGLHSLGAAAPRVVHPVVLLAEAYRREAADRSRRFAG